MPHQARGDRDRPGGPASEITVSETRDGTKGAGVKGGDTVGTAVPPSGGKPAATSSASRSSGFRRRRWAQRNTSSR